MLGVIHQPHDKCFKRSLKEKKVAVDYLKSHLQPEVYKRINIKTLELTDKSFISPQFREIHSDIIYHCKIDDKEGYIFFLLEAESTANENLMAFRKLQYTVGVMDQHIQQGYKKLPIVLPICIYHGSQSPYPHSLDVYDLFDDARLARQVAFKPFTLIDLTTLSDEEISQHGLAALMEMLLKHGRAKNFLTILNQRIEFIRGILNQLGKEYRRFVVKYMINETQDEAPNAVDQLVQTLVTAFPGEKDTIMTFAQQLEQKGLQKGLKQGRREEDLVIAKRMLNMGVDYNFIKKATHLSDQDLLNLEG
ncbi:MAG: Rpn family recombination-promoting nuclease/putative transposase [Pseudomonadota bacterium]